MHRLRRWLTTRRGPAIVTMLDTGFVAIDVETTGLNPGSDALVAFAAVPFAGGHPERGYSTLVNPGRRIPATSTAIHGVTDAMVTDAPSAGQVVAELDALLAGRVLVGHGIDFDLAVINRARRASGLPKLRNLALDTLRLAAVVRPGGVDFTLERVAAQLGIEVVGRHTATGDALTAGRLLVALLPSLERAGFRTVPELQWAQRHARLGA